MAEAILPVVVQGVSSVSEYEQLFCHCFCAAVRPFHGPDGAARAFERGLRLQLRRPVMRFRRQGLRAVIDAAYTVEEDILRVASLRCYICRLSGNMARDCLFSRLLRPGRRGGHGPVRRRGHQQQHQRFGFEAPPLP